MNKTYKHTINAFVWAILNPLFTWQLLDWSNWKNKLFSYDDEFVRKDYKSLYKQSKPVNS
jgi:hypothetical protein